MGRHLNLIDRNTIMRMLNQGESIFSISAEIDFNKSTVSREIKNRRRYFPYDNPHKRVAKNACIHRSTCIIHKKCNARCVKTVKNCRRCVECSVLCKEFVEEICAKYNSPPYVCNACEGYSKCPLSKWIYDADYAHNHYASLLSEARAGISIDENTLIAVDNLISPLLKKGQSIRHVCMNNKDDIMLSEKTIYRYIGQGLLAANKFDLKRTVQRKIRKKAGPPLLVDKECRKGRTYADYLKFMEDNNYPPTVQLDTVEGKKGGKVILTIFFCNCNVQLSFLRDRNTAASVTKVFRKLLKLLGPENYTKLFFVILLDRGSEFSDPLSIEIDPETGEQLAHVFYCDPQNSNQKAECERNHEFIRYFLPQGKSFDNRTVEDIALMMDHINSYGRAMLNDKAPIEMFDSIYGEELRIKLGINLISPNDIVLSPKLFD